MKDTFSTFHPLITFAFYIFAVAFAMLFFHPAYLVAAVTCSAAYLLTVKGRRALPLMAGLAVLFCVLMLVNPLINPLGDTVLFTYLGGRHFTLEAVRYGAVVASMLCTVVMLFASYNETMTSDKFIYLFGRFAPSVTLLLTMILRLVPSYTNRAKQIESTRMSIGKGIRGEKKDMVKNGAAVLSALMTWALENGVVTSDSMQSRGYGTGRRTSYSTYRFFTRDKVLAACMLVLAGAVIGCSAAGGTRVNYIPNYDPTSITDPRCLAGLIIYLVFLLIPTVINVAEALRWHILRSKI